MVYDIFADSGVLEFFKMDERKVMAFIAAVCSHYHKNPYHNFCHVVYVLHCTYMLIMRSEIAKSLTRVDQLVLLIAALCHDVDHDGEAANSRAFSPQAVLRVICPALHPAELTRA